MFPKSSEQFFIVAQECQEKTPSQDIASSLRSNLDQLHPLRFHQLASSEFAQTELSGFWIPIGISHTSQESRKAIPRFFWGRFASLNRVNGEIFPFKSYQLPNKCAHIWLTEDSSEDHHIFKQQHYCQSGCFCGEQPFQQPQYDMCDSRFAERLEMIQRHTRAMT